MGEMSSQITSLTIVYSNVYSGVDQSKHQSSASLAFVWGIHREPVNSPHKWPVTRKMFPFDDVIMSNDTWRHYNTMCYAQCSAFIPLVKMVIKISFLSQIVILSYSHSRNSNTLIFSLLKIVSWLNSIKLIWTVYICIMSQRRRSLSSPLMMMTSNGNIFRVTGPVCGEFTRHRWIPGTKASDAELLMFSLICAWINRWVNKCEAGDLRRYRAHYDVIVMLPLRKSRKITTILKFWPTVHSCVRSVYVWWDIFTWI